MLQVCFISLHLKSKHHTLEWRRKQKQSFYECLSLRRKKKKRKTSEQQYFFTQHVYGADRPVQPLPLKEMIKFNQSSDKVLVINDSAMFLWLLQLQVKSGRLQQGFTSSERGHEDRRGETGAGIH